MRNSGLAFKTCRDFLGITFALHLHLTESWRWQSVKTHLFSFVFRIFGGVELTTVILERLSRKYEFPLWLVLHLHPIYNGYIWLGEMGGI